MPATPLTPGQQATISKSIADWMRLSDYRPTSQSVYDVYINAQVIYHEWDGETHAATNCPTWTGTFFDGECKCMLAPEEQ